MKYRDIYSEVCKLAPIELSAEFVEAVDGYDNSGIILETEKDIDKVLFALDLTPQCADYALENGFNLIITHHPAIYNPIKSLDLTKNYALTKCAINGVGVISMHLNLDVAEDGIDASLAFGLGAKKPKILIPLKNGVGYGRLFNVDKMPVSEFKKRILEVFETDNVMIFGNREGEVSKVASFCGAGCDIKEIDLAEGADVIVSADFKHHVIMEAVNRGIRVVQLSHYASENYGMKRFAKKVANVLQNLKVSYYGMGGF